MDSYNRLERRLEIEKLIKQANELAFQAIEQLAKGNIKLADDYHIKIQHLLEQVKAGIDQLKHDLES